MYDYFSAVDDVGAGLQECGAAGSAHDAAALHVVYGIVMGVLAGECLDAAEFAEGECHA